jgi:hypothetical protein
MNLNADQQKELEEFVAANPSIEKELALLQRSKLQPEQIIFRRQRIFIQKRRKGP